jgi:hypothetical protein
LVVYVRILIRMVLAVAPAWAAPAAQEIRDAHRIVVARLAAGSDVQLQAMADTFAWVAGEAPSPLQTRPGPVGRLEVADELMHAQMVMSGPEQLLDGDRAPAVELVLRWLLGMHGARPPVLVPMRRPDGHVVTADELYTLRMRGQPPERRTAVRVAAVRDAARYAQLAELAASVTA